MLLLTVLHTDRVKPYPNWPLGRKACCIYQKHKRLTARVPISSLFIKTTILCQGECKERRVAEIGIFLSWDRCCRIVNFETYLVTVLALENIFNQFSYLLLTPCCEKKTFLRIKIFCFLDIVDPSSLVSLVRN